MPDTPATQVNTRETQWAQWPMTALERIRLPYPWVMVLMALLGAVSVALDTALRYRLHGIWPARDVAVGVSSIVVSVYILAYMRLIKRVSGRALTQLRPSVQISDEEYEGYVRRFLHARGAVEVLLIVLAVLLMVFFLVLPPDQLRGLPHTKPAEFAATVVVALYWTILFYLLLSLVYISIRNARALGGLAKRPLEINVFDPIKLLPLGRLGLLQSLGFVGVFLIPLIILGPPSRQGGGWFVIGLSVLSLLAIFVPLWGVHQQIVKARERVLAGIYADLLAVQQVLLQSGGQETEHLRILSQRSELLFQFRKQVLGGPSWPFGSSAAVWRAIVAASSPLAYFLLNHFLQTYFFPLVGLK
jgi:hypothetical protein